MRRTNPNAALAIETLWLSETETPRPVCPQFRPYPNEAVYPVRGHCAPLHRPGLFVIPSIEEYGLYCTDPGFARCPWFQGGHGTPRPCDTRHRNASLAQDGTGIPQDVGARVPENAG